jgi:hypothetical protein
MAPWTGPFAFLPLRRLAAVVFSLAAGTLTHVAWDSVTHVHGWHGEPYRWLNALVFSSEFGELRVHNVTQTVSTALGAALLALAYWRWYRRTPPHRDPCPGGNRIYAFAVVGAIGLGAGLAALSAVAHLLPRLLAMPDMKLLHFVGGRAVVVCIAAVGIECLIFGLAWHWRQPAMAPAPASDGDELRDGL